MKIEFADCHKMFQAHWDCSNIEHFPFPSSTILGPKVNSCCLGYEAFTDWCLFVGQFNLTWLSCFNLFSSFPLCCVGFSHSFFAACWRGEAPEQTKSKRLFVPPGIRKHTWTLSFLCLPTSYIHPARAWVWLQHSTMLHLCAPAHTPEYHNGAPWTSPSNWHPVASVSLLYSLYVTSSSAQSISLSLFSLHLSNWWPHPAPTLMWLHQAAAAFKATEQVRLLCLGHPGETDVVHNFNKFPLSNVSSQALHLKNPHLWICGQYQLNKCPLVVWEIKVFGLFKATIKSQQGRQRIDKERMSLPLSLHLLSLSHVSHVFFLIIISFFNK